MLHLIFTNFTLNKLLHFSTIIFHINKFTNFYTSILPSIFNTSIHVVFSIYIYFLLTHIHITITLYKYHFNSKRNSNINTYIIFTYAYYYILNNLSNYLTILQTTQTKNQTLYHQHLQTYQSNSLST